MPLTNNNFNFSIQNTPIKVDSNLSFKVKKAIQYPTVLFFFGGRLVAASGLSLLGIVGSLKKLGVNNTEVQKILGIAAVAASAYTTTRIFLPSVNNQVYNLFHLNLEIQPKKLAKKKKSKHKSTEINDPTQKSEQPKDMFWLAGHIPKALAYGSMGFSSYMSFVATYKLTNWHKSGRPPHLHDYNELELWQTLFAIYVLISSVACYSAFTLPKVKHNIDDVMNILRAELNPVFEDSKSYVKGEKNISVSLKNFLTRKKVLTAINFLYCTLGNIGYNAGGFYSMHSGIKFIPGLMPWNKYMILSFSLMTGLSTNAFTGILPSYRMLDNSLNFITRRMQRNSQYMSLDDKTILESVKEYLVNFDREKLQFIVDMFVSLPLGILNQLFNNLQSFLGMLVIIAALDKNNFLPFPVTILFALTFVASSTSQLIGFYVLDPLGLKIVSATDNNANNKPAEITIDPTNKEDISITVVPDLETVPLINNVNSRNNRSSVVNNSIFKDSSKSLTSIATIEDTNSKLPFEKGYSEKTQKFRS